MVACVYVWLLALQISIFFSHRFLFYSNRCLTQRDNSSYKSYRCRTWMANCRMARVVMGQGIRRTERAPGMNVIHISKFVWRNTCVSLQLARVVSELDIRPHSEGIHFLPRPLWGTKNPSSSCHSDLPGRWVGYTFSTTCLGLYWCAAVDSALVSARVSLWRDNSAVYPGTATPSTVTARAFAVNSALQFRLHPRALLAWLLMNVRNFYPCLHSGEHFWAAWNLCGVVWQVLMLVYWTECIRAQISCFYAWVWNVNHFIVIWTWCRLLMGNAFLYSEDHFLRCCSLKDWCVWTVNDHVSWCCCLFGQTTKVIQNVGQVGLLSDSSSLRLLGSSSCTLTGGSLV